MRVLIIGSGGREHALSWKVARSGKAEKIYCAPGNGGTAQEGENIPLKDSDVAGLVSFAKGNVIDFVIPGPELPLTLGVVDAMTQAGIRCFGPSQWCAQLEGSKAFAKDIMQKAGVPTAACGVFTELEAAKSFVEEKGAPIVIKADGLAAGKGVVVAQTKEEALEALDQIMGGVFGAVSFYDAITGASAMTGALFQVSPVNTFILCVGMRVLMGVCVGLIFNGLSKLDKSRTWSYIVSAMCAPALNTLFFMGYIVLAFYNCDYVQNLVSVKGAANPLMFVVLLVGVQGVAEFLVSGILGGIVARAVHKFLK